MSTEKKKFEVVQCIPAFTYVTYHVEAGDEDEAIQLVMSQDESIENVGEYTHESDFTNEFNYEVEEIN